MALADLRSRTSVKWRTYPDDVLPLWVAEMDVLPAPAVVDAVQRAVASGDTGYPVPRTYLDAVVRWYDRAFGVTVDPGRTMIAADVMTGVEHVLRAATAPEAGVVITTPVYPPFHSAVGDAGRRLVTASLTDEGRLDLGTIDDALVAAGAGSAVLLSNPHNPSGAVHTRDELAAVLRLAHARGARVVADEIHAPLVLPGAGFTSVLDVPGGERAVVVTSAAKGWNLAGFKAAAIIAGDEATDVMAAIPEVVAFHASHIAVIAQVAALDDGEQWRAALVRDLDANRTLLGELIAEHLPGVGYRWPASTYLAWLDCRGLGLGDDPAAAFRQRGRVALNSGRTFGAEGAGFVRLNYATSPEILQEAVRRMAAAL